MSTSGSPAAFVPLSFQEVRTPAPGAGDWTPPDLDPARASRPLAGTPTLREQIEEAYRQGVADAEAEAAQRADERVRSSCAALCLAAEAVRGMEHELLRGAQSDLAALSLAVAQKIVAREIATSGDIVTDLVQRALALLPEERALTVRLHPEDAEAVGASLADTTVRCVADASLDRGNFVVEGPQRVIDGRADVALRALYERFDGV